MARPHLAADALGGEPDLQSVDGAEREISAKDVPDGLGLGRVDDQLAVLDIVAERDDAAHSHALALGGGDLVADALAGVADEWTLEYDLAFHGLGKHIYRAASLALADDGLNAGTTDHAAVLAAADAVYLVLVNTAHDQPTLASHVYALFEADGASKAIAAQYLAELLEKESADGALDAEGLRAQLPPYVVAALAHVTEPFVQPPAGGVAAEPEPPAATPNPAV